MRDKAENLQIDLEFNRKIHLWLQAVEARYSRSMLSGFAKSAKHSGSGMFNAEDVRRVLFGQDFDDAQGFHAAFGGPEESTELANMLRSSWSSSRMPSLSELTEEQLDQIGNELERSIARHWPSFQYKT